MLGEGLFVAVDDLVGVVVEVAESDEAAAFADFGAIGHGVRLRIAVQGQFRFFGEDAFSAPVFQVFGGAGIAVVGLLAGRKSGVGVAGLVLAEDDADEVVGAALVVALPACRA